MSEGDARPRTFERFDVQRVLIVLGCPVTTSGLGLEHTNLRRVADDTECRGILPAANTAPEADISDDPKRYSKGQKMAESAEDKDAVTEHLDQDREQLAIEAGRLRRQCEDGCLIAFDKATSSWFGSWIVWLDQHVICSKLWKPSVRLVAGFSLFPSRGLTQPLTREK